MLLGVTVVVLGLLFILIFIDEILNDSENIKRKNRKLRKRGSCINKKGQKGEDIL